MPVKETIPGAGPRSARPARRGLDHAVRAYDRHSEVLGNQLAAAITYFGFLSFFPLLALAFAAGRLHQRRLPGGPGRHHGSRRRRLPEPDRHRSWSRSTSRTSSPPRARPVSSACVGLLYAGLGWLDALRVGLRRVFGTEDEPLPFVKKKTVDLLVLVLLGHRAAGLARRQQHGDQRDGVRPRDRGSRRLAGRGRAAQGARGGAGTGSSTRCCSRSCSRGSPAPA